MSLITSIQKYSIHDGEGIRTTVFFKGCGLKCTWCHNPETQSFQKELLFAKENCVSCGACVSVCPNQAIELNNGEVKTNREKCDVCGTCLDWCDLNLREITGKEYSIEQLIKELKKDEMFYEESGGGVTLSGGEVMAADMEYIEALVKKLNRIGISVNIDTCGQAPYENFERILPYIDTFLYDIKTIDTDLHKEHMGVGNELILANLEKLSRAGANVFIRIPVIKGVNATARDMKEIIGYLQEKNIQTTRIHLLPYHNTGSGKYQRLGIPYRGEALQAPDNDEMNHFLELFKEVGFHDVRIGG